jgi:hypothetical protein
LFYNACQLAGKSDTRTVELFADLIPNTPDEYGRMIAISFYLVFQVLFMPLFEINVVIVFVLFLAPHIKGFVHNQKTHFIAEIKELRRRWIVRRTDRITTHCFQHL